MRAPVLGILFHQTSQFLNCIVLPWLNCSRAFSAEPTSRCRPFKSKLFERSVMVEILESLLLLMEEPQMIFQLIRNIANMCD